MRKKVSAKCFVALLALCIIFLLPICVMAAETGDKKTGAYTYRYNEEYAGIEIVKYDVNKQKSRVQVPDRIDNIPVTVIGEKAFMEEDEIIAKRRKNRSIQEVVLPETVVALKAHAFDGCTRLKKIQYSGNLKILEEGVFNDCRKLENFSLPEELKEIPASLFRYCYNLKEISIPKSVVVIGDYAFDCTEIKEAELEDLELKRIGDYAFARCNLTKITLPDSLEEIGAGAFENCRKLKKVKFGAKTIGYYNSGRGAKNWHERVYALRFIKKDQNTSNAAGDWPFRFFGLPQTGRVHDSGRMDFNSCRHVWILQEFERDNDTEGHNLYSGQCI